MSSLFILYLLSALGSNESPQWDAAICFSGRGQRPRRYFSECSQEPLNWKEWCAPYKTKFSLRTGPRLTEKLCRSAVRQNHPSVWHYRNVRLPRNLPVICDFNEAGPPSEECYADRRPISEPDVVR